MEKKFTDSESILLNFSDLNLSYTGDIFDFSKSIEVDNFNYENLIYVDNCRTKPIGYDVVNGDGRGAVKISTKEREPIYYLFGANRYTSNASNIAIGYQDSNKDFVFLYESFGDMYSKKPILTTRNLITVDSLYSNEKKIIRLYDYICDKKINISTEDLKKLLHVLKKMQEYQTAFSKSNIKKLVIKKYK